MNKWVFENEANAKAFYESTGYHWEKDGIDNYSLDFGLRESIDAVRSNRQLQEDMGAEDVRRPDNSLFRLKFMKVNSEVLNSKYLPLPGESISLINELPFEEVTSVMELFRSYGSRFSDLSPAHSKMSKADYEEGKKGEVENPHVKSRSKVRTSESDMVRVITDEYNTGGTPFAIPNFGLYILYNATPKSRNDYIFHTMSNVDIRLVANPNGSLAIVIDWKKRVATHSNYDQETSPAVVDTFVSELISHLGLRECKWWKVVNAVIVNNVVSLWEHPHEIDGNGNRRAHTSAKNKFVCYTEDVYEDTQAYLDASKPLDPNEFVKRWTDRALKTARDQVKAEARELKELKARMINLSRTYGEKRSMYLTMRESASSLFTKTIEPISKIPLVTKVEFHANVMVVTTDDLWYQPRSRGASPEKGKRYIGQFTIHVGLEDSYAYYINHNMTRNVIHPHTSNSSPEYDPSMCMGNYENLIASSFELMDYEAVISTIMSMLQDTTEDDTGAFDKLRLLPNEKPTDGTVSPPTTIYGNYTRSDTVVTSLGETVDITKLLDDGVNKKKGKHDDDEDEDDDPVEDFDDEEDDED